MNDRTVSGDRCHQPVARLLPLAAVWIAAAGGGCFVSTNLPDNALIGCASDADCPAEAHCQTALGLCVRDDIDDRAGPKLLSSEIDPPIAIPGDRLSLRFTVDERLGLAPKAWLERQGARLDMTLGSFANGTAAELSYLVSGTESEGEWRVDIAAIDALGNEATLAAGAAFLDVSGPLLEDLAWEPAGASVGQTSELTLTARVSSPARVDRVEIFDGDVSRGTVVATLLPTLDPAWLDFIAAVRVSDLALVGAGTLAVEVTILDAVGNPTRATTPVLAYDVDAPDTSLVLAPPPVTYDIDLSFTFTATDDALGFLCSLDGATPASCTSPFTLVDVPLGAHTLAVAAIDGQGNVDPSPASTSWVVNRRWRSLAAGFRHTCGLGSDDRLFCWGDNTKAQLGRGSTLTSQAAGDPGQVDSDLERFAQVAVGRTHSCAVAKAGNLWCWGNNASGQLGLGTASALAKESPVQVGVNDDWLEVATGSEHSCGLRGSPSGASLYCWGKNTSGELGLGFLVPLGAVRVAPAQVTDVDWLRVVVRETYACGIRDDGGDRTVWCWGNGTETPQQKAGVSDATELAIGSSQACAITGAGALWCWGDNLTGETQGSSTSHPPEPVLVTQTWRAVALNNGTGCGVDTAGVLWCWGLNNHGQAGVGSSSVTIDPTVVDDSRDWIGVSIDRHACAWSSSGEAACFGGNDHGQLGQGFVADVAPSPRAALSTTAYSKLALMRHYRGLTYGRACALTTAGALHCWGDDTTPSSLDPNLYDMLKNGEAAGRDTPGPSAGVAAAHVWAVADNGLHHLCLVSNAGRAFCGGANVYGSLGSPAGNSSIMSEVPLDATPTFATDWLSISTGGFYSCGLRGTGLPGSLWCWGRNNAGQLGQSNLSVLSYPQPIAGAWRALAAGYEHTCAIRDDGSFGEMYCWGRSRGVGQGTCENDTAVSTPAVVGGDTDWIAIAAGRDTSCGIRDAGGTGTLHCWGENEWGQAGSRTVNLGVPMPNCTPVTLAGAGWVVVSVGADHSCGIRDGVDGRTLWCWGHNDMRQLGYATNDDLSDTPVQVGTDVDWQTVAAGEATTCAVKLDGSLWCWGTYFDGLIGDGLRWAESPAIVAAP